MGFYFPNVDPLYLYKRQGTAEDPFIPLQQDFTVKYQKFTLKEIPDFTTKVTIIDSNGTTLTEVTTDTVSEGQYRVDYSTGNIFFHVSAEGQSFHINYLGTGYVTIPANRTIVDSSATNSEELSLQDILDQQGNINDRLNDANSNMDTIENLIATNQVAKKSELGDLTTLNTNDKSSVVNAINEHAAQLADIEKQKQVTRAMRDTFFRGIAIRGWSTGWFDSTTARDDFLALVGDINATDVQVVVNFYQDGLNANEPNRYPISDVEIENYLKYLKSNNKRIFFKPHLEPGGTLWRANIQPTDVDAWFANYQAKIIAWATLCETYGVEVFSVGSEYYWLTDNYPDKWRDVIAAVREVFSGYITYAAGFNTAKGDEAQRLQFWDALDFIAVNFYVRGDFTPGTTYSDDYIRSFLNFDSQHGNPLNELDSLAHRVGSKIVLSEFGVPFLSNGDHIPNLREDFDFMSQFFRIMLNEIVKYDWFIGAIQWGYDYNEMDLSTSEQSKNVISEFYKQRRLISRSKGVEVKGVTYSTNGSYYKIAEIKLPSNRTNIYASLEFSIEAEKPTSTVQYFGELFVRLSIGSDGYIRKTVFIKSGNIGGRIFYTLNGTDLVIWASLDGDPFRVNLIKNDYPIFCTLYDLSPDASSTLPSGAITVLSAPQFKSIEQGYHSGSQNLQVDSSDRFCRYTLNGDYTLSLKPSLSGLSTQYLIEFIQDSTGYRNLTLSGITQPLGNVMIDPSPGSSTFVQFLWNGSQWVAFNVGNPLGKTVSRTTTPAIGYGANTNITCRRAGNVVTYKWAINVTGTLGSSAEVAIFHAEYWPTNETYYGIAFADSTGSAPAGMVRWQGTTMYFTPTQTLQNTWLRGTLSFVVDN